MFPCRRSAVCGTRARILRTPAGATTSFRGYADYMQTEAFQDALATLIEMSREKSVAIMCAEAVPWRCHRSLVADALSVRDVPASRFYRRPAIARIVLRLSRRWKERKLPIRPSSRC